MGEDFGAGDRPFDPSPCRFPIHTPAGYPWQGALPQSPRPFHRPRELYNQGGRKSKGNDIALIAAVLPAGPRRFGDCATATAREGGARYANLSCFEAGRFDPNSLFGEGFGRSPMPQMNVWSRFGFDPGTE